MPTRHPRLNVTVTEEQHALLLELASLEGFSASSFLRSMLDQVTPLLRTTVPMLRAAAEEREITREKARAMLAPVLRELSTAGMLDQLDLLDAAESAPRPQRASASEDGRTPRRSRANRNA